MIKNFVSKKNHILQGFLVKIYPLLAKKEFGDQTYLEIEKAKVERDQER